METDLEEAPHPITAYHEIWNDAAKLDRYVLTRRANCKPDEARFCELFVGPCRFNVRKACKELRINVATGHKWQLRAHVREYASALMMQATAKLFVSRDVMIREIAHIALSDAGELLSDIANAALELGQEREVAENQGEVAKNEDGAVRASPSLSEHGVSGADIIARLAPAQSKTIKKIKFTVATTTREVLDAEGEVVERVITERPVIEAVEMHDKQRALALMAPWFGLTDGALSDEEAAKAKEEFTGITVIRPGEQEEKDND